MNDGLNCVSKSPEPKKRPTVAAVDKKIDELTEVLDILHSDVKDIKEIMKSYIEMRLKDAMGPDETKKDENDTVGMYS